MATKKVTNDPTSKVGKPASEYNTPERGDSWFDDEQNTMDRRKTDNTSSGKPYDGSGRALSNQLKDQSKTSAEGVKGAIPQYKKGGMVKKTGVALVHKGEKVIPKKDVKRTSKAMKKYGGKR
jgi:hypothetical protein